MRKLVLAILICQLAGIIGSVFTISSIPTWYASLNKPFFSPPNSIFGPVWVILYTLMGISLYIVWKSKVNKRLKTPALRFFYIQLILNSLWSILFFGLKSPLLAFIEILVLLIMIAATIVKFYKISPPSAYLLAPYLLWVTFASVLNLAIVLLN